MGRGSSTTARAMSPRSWTRTATPRRSPTASGSPTWSTANPGNIRIAEGYYLGPDGQVAAKPYKLLRQALGRSSKVAIAKYAGSGRERLGLLRLRDDAIVLHAMRWPDEVRDPAAVDPPNETVSEEEIEQALVLIDRMTQDDLEGSEFTDAHTDALAKIIEAKREEKPLPEAPEPEQRGKVLDLMAALKESVQQAKASRGEGADVHEMPKKKTAKKQPAKRTAAKETTKKRTARRSRSA
ncbi:Ku protein [Streptomyces sp. SAI-144]|uniref:Ku protein n=1 Tax=Streptomyces sp. SAI-144 TaxID=2940544 RepID=UPI0032AEF39A